VGLIEKSTYPAHQNKCHAGPEEAADEERRIRRGMRLVPGLSAKKKTKLVPTILGRATLVASGVLLGWAGSRLWHE